MTAIDHGTTVAIRRVMAAMGCREQWDDLSRVAYCSEHNFGWLRDINACPHAERVTIAARRDVTA